MFKQLIALFLLGLFAAAQAYSEEKVSPSDAERPQCPCRKVQPILELKNGYFFFSDPKMRKVYDDGGWDVQLSVSYPVWRWLEIYGSVEYLQRRGRSLFDGERTSIWEVPLSLGLKPVIVICPWAQYYFALGPRYCFVRQHNHSFFVERHLGQSGLGGFVNTGFNFIICRHFLIDMFAEYSYVKMHFHSTGAIVGRNMQVGGFAFGGGLGYAF